jgi:type IV pilus assembly protein PilE
MNAIKGTSMKKSIGFTLVEMMVVVAVIAILSAIAFPAYSKFVQRSRRVEAQTLINTVMQAQEKFFSTYNRYTANLTAAGPVGLGIAPHPGGPQCPAGLVLSENCYYSVTAVLVGVGNQDVQIVAAPRRTQTTDKCGSLQATAAGVKTFSGTIDNGKCW